MLDTEVEEPSGATQHHSSAMMTSTILANMMAMTPGIMPPGKLNLSSTEEKLETFLPLMAKITWLLLTATAATFGSMTDYRTPKPVPPF